MQSLIKRIFDLIFSVGVIVIISPLLFLIAIILFLTGEHEIFYLKTRLGYQNKPFKMIKFATMLKNSMQIGSGSITLRNDPRITPVGSFLRKTKLNELPQLINVVTGEMSIVGPRPQMMEDIEKFPEKERENLFKVKPGITGIGSIVFRDEEKWISNAAGDKHLFYKNHIAPHKCELESWYRQNMNLLIDVLIIFVTAWTILFPKSHMVYKIFKGLPKKPEILS